VYLDVHQDRFQIIRFVDGEFEPRSPLTDTEAVFSIAKLQKRFTKVAVPPFHLCPSESFDVLTDFPPRSDIGQFGEDSLSNSWCGKRSLGHALSLIPRNADCK
jgi:hypothetical protein